MGLEIFTIYYLILFKRKDMSTEYERIQENIRRRKVISKGIDDKGFKWWRTEKMFIKETPNGYSVIF